jgi:hypothetical protein
MTREFEFLGHWDETVRMQCTGCGEDLLDDMEFPGHITLQMAYEAAEAHACRRYRD